MLRMGAKNKMAQNNNTEKRLWDAANALWTNSGLKPSQFSIPVLGLIFLRFADFKFEKIKKEIEKTASKSNRREVGKDDFKSKGIYIPEKSRYSYLLSLSEGSNISAAINEAMKAIEEENEDLKGILPKDYSDLSNDMLFALLKTFSKIEVDIEGDLFGKIYEYFLGKFAMAEGQKGGVFYTPTSIVKLIVEVIEPLHGKIYDPACGSGGMFVQSAKFIENHKKSLLLYSIILLDNF